MSRKPVMRTVESNVWKAKLEKRKQIDAEKVFIAAMTELMSDEINLENKDKGVIK